MLKSKNGRGLLGFVAVEKQSYCIQSPSSFAPPDCYRDLGEDAENWQILNLWLKVPCLLMTE